MLSGGLSTLPPPCQFEGSTYLERRFRPCHSRTASDPLPSRPPETQTHGRPRSLAASPKSVAASPKSVAASPKSVASTIPSDTVELAVLLYKVALRNWRADTTNPQNRKTLEDSAIAIRRVILGYHTLLDDDGRDVVAEFLKPLVASN